MTRDGFGRGGRYLCAAAVLAMLAIPAAPAGASRFGPSGPPWYPSFPFELRSGSGGPETFVQDGTDPHKWVWTIDPQKYGATGTITFYDWQNAVAQSGTMRGPGGVGVNDWQVCSPVDPFIHCGPGHSAFDFSRPSFTQDVDVVPPDFATVDPPSDIASDYNVAAFARDELQPPPQVATHNPAVYPNANMDGSANLFKFGFSIAPGTQFMNMQVDRAGNYYVARRDMQWDWIDSFTYKQAGSSAPAQKIPTQFDIQPYPISDAYGWCGAIPADDPSSLEPMAGQLIKDIAFDVYVYHGGPKLGVKPFSTEIVPSFMMRSYGRYVVDVTMLSMGVHQHFEGVAKGVHIRLEPLRDGNGDVIAGKEVGTRVAPGDPDFDRWYNRVSPFAAGVVPRGAWVINEGSPTTMQVVAAGTPGAVWHQNKFAGAAFLVRGDMERRVNYVLAGDPAVASDQGTTSGYHTVYKDLFGEADRGQWTDWTVDGLHLQPGAH